MLVADMPTCQVPVSLREDLTLQLRRGTEFSHFLRGRRLRTHGVEAIYKGMLSSYIRLCQVSRMCWHGKRRPAIGKKICTMPLGQAAGLKFTWHRLTQLHHRQSLRLLLLGKCQPRFPWPI